MTGYWLTSYVVLWASTIASLVIALALLRLVGELYQRIPPTVAAITGTGPDLGTSLPEVSTVSLNGETVGLGSSRSLHQLLVYVSSTCSTCQALGPAVRSIAKEFRSSLTVVLVGLGDSNDLERFVTRTKLTKFPAVLARNLPDDYQVETTPFALIVDEGGTVIAKGLINRREHLVSVIEAGFQRYLNFESVTSSGLKDVATESGTVNHAHEHSGG